MSNKIGTALLAVLGTATLAQAQEAQQEPIVLDAIVLQGEQVPKLAKETASSVVLVPAEDLAARRVDDLFDLVERTPNLSVVADGRDIAIRGVPKAGLAATEDVLTQASGDVIGTFIDGVPVSTWGGPTSTWDVGRVEIFRGAQTTYSGRGSLGGAVYIYTPDPTPEWTFSSRGIAGNFGSRTLSGLISGPLSPDAGVRLSLDYDKSDGFIDNVTAGVHQDIDEAITFKGKFQFAPTDASLFTLSYLHSDREKGGGLASISQSKGDDYVSFANVPERLNKTVDTLALDGRYDLSPILRIESLTTFGSENADRAVDGDTGPQDLLRADVDEELRQYSQELKLVYDDPAASWRGFAGVYGRRFERDSRNLISGFISIDNQVSLDANTLALFGEATVDLTEDFHVTAGGRVENERFDADFNGGGGTSASGDYTVPLPRLALAYDLTDEITATALVQRGYRGGSAGASILTATTYVADPEYTWNYEAGLRGNWLGGDLTSAVNAFYTDWTDQQVSMATALGSPLDATIVNAGRSTIYGIEAELRYQATEAIEVYGGGSLLHTEFDEFISGGDDFSGNAFPYAPDYMLSAGINYKADNGLFASTGLSWQGAAFSDAENAPDNRVGARAIVDASVGYEWKGISATAFVKNLFNEEYVLTKAAQVDLMAPGKPRTYGFELKATF